MSAQPSPTRVAADAFRVLIVDDDVTVRALLRGHLALEGFRIDEAEDAAGLRRAMAAGGIDAVLLDIRLPGIDGLTLTRELRDASEVGVILITGRGDKVDRILGLEYGADDFLVKPVDERELVPRLRNLCRRVRQCRAGASRGMRRIGLLSFDLEARRLQADDGTLVPLTTAEYQLLAAITRSPGRVYSRDELIEATGRSRFNPLDRTVDTLVARLRRKVEPDPEHPRHLVTVHGAGYTFAP